MRVNKLQLLGFPSEDAQRAVELPERGIVLVTGPNGSGKSSMVEALAWATWGKTLRGRKPEGEPLVSFQLHGGGWIERDGNRLRFGGTLLPDGQPVEFTTRMKAQDHLATLVGPWDEWRRTHVFSSSDSAAFASATDGERKRLVEGILGLSRFDTALEACRADLVKARQERSELQVRSDNLRFRAKEARRREEDADRSMKALPKYEPADVLESMARIEDGKADELAHLFMKHDRLAHDHALSAQRSDIYLQSAKEALERVRAGKCETCGAPMVGDATRMEEELDGFRQTKEIHEKGATHNRNEALTAKQQGNAARRKADELRCQAKAAQSLEESLTRLAKAIVGAQQEAEKLEREERNAVAGWERAIKECTLLEQCEKVLGLKGARALVLERAMGAVGEAADSWLRRLSGGALGVSLVLEHDEGLLRLVVEGAGGGTYEGCSGGQRRRIDLALLMALAEVAAAAVGRPAGTLWLDEVFDALDDEGIAAAADAVRSLAGRRCCVVITHHAGLADALKPDLHLRLGA